MHIESSLSVCSFNKRNESDKILVEHVVHFVQSDVVGNYKNFMC